MEEDKKPEGKRYRTMESIAGVFTESDVRQKLFGNKGFQFYLFQKRWKKIVGSLMAEEPAAKVPSSSSGSPTPPSSSSFS